MERNAPIRAKFSAEDETPLNVIQAKTTREDLTLGAEDGTLGAIANPRRTRADAGFPKPPAGPPPPARGRRAPPQPEPEDGGWTDGDEDDGEDGDDEEDDDGFADPFEEPVDADMVAQAERMRSEKMNIVNRLHRLAQRGVDVPSHLSIRSPLDDLRSELSKVENDLQVRYAIRQQRRMLMGLVTGLTWMTTDLVPDLGIELDGWDKSVLSSIEEYDDVFEELYNLYGNKLKMHPLLKLVYMIGTSAAMYHVTSSMMKHTKGVESAAPQTQAEREAAEGYLRDAHRKFVQQEREQEERGRQREAQAQQAKAAADLYQGRHAVGPMSRVDVLREGQGQKDAAVRASLTPSNFLMAAGERAMLQGDHNGTSVPMTPPPLTVPGRESEYKMRGPAMTMSQPVGVLARVSAADTGPAGGTPDLGEIRPDMTVHPEVPYEELPPELAGARDAEALPAVVPAKKVAPKGRGRKKKDDGEGVDL